MALMNRIFRYDSPEKLPIYYEYDGHAYRGVQEPCRVCREALDANMVRYTVCGRVDENLKLRVEITEYGDFAATEFLAFFTNCGNAETKRLRNVRIVDGLIEGDVHELQWGDVDGWTGLGGAELGISRRTPTVRDFYGIGRGLEQHQIDGLMVVGGWDAFEAAHTLRRERERYPAFQIPLILLPATIDNNIPGTELTVGADSALNMIVDSMDRVRQAGTASRRCFVVETMGSRCGYLALMSALSGGAVQVYLHEEGITLAELAKDVERMVASFRAGQRIFVTVINEKASDMYTTEFLCRLFEQESQGLFDAREVVLGPTQQGGAPSPFDRILATRLAAHSMDWLRDQIDSKRTGGAVIGMHEGGVRVISLRDTEELADWENRRPVHQWWMRLRPTIEVLGSRLAVNQV